MNGSGHWSRSLPVLVAVRQHCRAAVKLYAVWESVRGAAYGEGSRKGPGRALEGGRGAGECAWRRRSRARRRASPVVLVTNHLRLISESVACGAKHESFMTNS